ncbi:hypothetical protein Tco_0264576 [Tanacetum coccineum]
MSNVKKSVAERTRHKRLYDRRVNKRQMQKQESKFDLGKELDGGLVVMESNGTELEVQDDSSRSGNETDADDTDIRTIYDKEPMAEVQLTVECNISAIGQQHTKQPEIINEGRVDQMEAHYIALELKYQNHALKSGQHGQILNEASNKAKMKKEIDAYETINIELEHRVATLLKENEALKKHYKDFSDSRKVFAIASLKNELRKLKGNSVDTKFAKTSVLGKPEVNSCAKIQSHKTRNSNKPVDQKTHTQKPGRQIIIGHRFSPNKTSTVYEKTSPRSDLRWKPTSRIFKTVGLRWVPTGKILASCTSKDDSELTHGSNVYIPIFMNPNKLQI